MDSSTPASQRKNYLYLYIKARCTQTNTTRTFVRGSKHYKPSPGHGRTGHTGQVEQCALIMQACTIHVCMHAYIGRRKSFHGDLP